MKGNGLCITGSSGEENIGGREAGTNWVGEGDTRGSVAGAGAWGTQRPSSGPGATTPLRSLTLDRRDPTTRGPRGTDSPSTGAGSRAQSWDSCHKLAGTPPPPTDGSAEASADLIGPRPPEQTRYRGTCTCQAQPNTRRTELSVHSATGKGGPHRPPSTSRAET